MAKYNVKKFAQSCESKQCKIEFKKDIIKNFCEAIITPHELNLDLRTITCIYCGKVSKVHKKEKNESN